jgi:hypothetical protein
VPRWVDTQTEGIDDERYAFRFVPRRPSPNWSEKTASLRGARSKKSAVGEATLPPDL